MPLGAAIMLWALHAVQSAAASAITTSRFYSTFSSIAVTIAWMVSVLVSFD